LLLDTHVLIWVLTGDARLTLPGRDKIAEADEVFVSAVTIWEIAIKHALNREGANRMPYSGRTAIERSKASGFEFLPITPEHAAAVGALRDWHGDPFDRLLIAQAMNEPLRLLTHDRQLAAYSDTVLFV
jgi:PIN domain nuclease of toxin-antitoxin system